MFNKKSKEELKKLKERMDEIGFIAKEIAEKGSHYFRSGNGELNELQIKIINRDDLIECDTCGCLIWKNKAIEKKFIKEENEIKNGDMLVLSNDGIFGSQEKKKEVCITKYFCKKCGAKYKKKENKNRG